jgi:hypothetical protein
MRSKTLTFELAFMVASTGIAGVSAAQNYPNQSGGPNMRHDRGTQNDQSRLDQGARDDQATARRGFVIVAATKAERAIERKRGHLAVGRKDRARQRAAGAILGDHPVAWLEDHLVALEHRRIDRRPEGPRYRPRRSVGRSFSSALSCCRSEPGGIQTSLKPVKPVGCCRCGRPRAPEQAHMVVAAPSVVRRGNVSERSRSNTIARRSRLA